MARAKKHTGAVNTYLCQLDLDNENVERYVALSASDPEPEKGDRLASGGVVRSWALVGTSEEAGDLEVDHVLTDEDTDDESTAESADDSTPAE